MSKNEPTPEDVSKNPRGQMGVTAAVAGGVAFALAVVLVALLGEKAEDNALAWSLLIVMAAGLLSALVAFVAAIVARLRGSRTQRGWIPLIVFPAILAFIVLGEAFWWE